MIKRLRIKLIIASMASLFAVLVTIMAVMAAVNYDKITDVADSTLSILMENDGMFPQMEQDSMKNLTGSRRRWTSQRGRSGDVA